MSRYCVIGAGAAGLSALQQLREAGYQVECFEKSDRVGGHWHTDYDSLHLITSRDMTYFEGFPMPADYPHFPRRDQISAYIESYAAHHGHYDLITFNTEVVSVTPEPAGDGPVGSAGWRVITSRGDEGLFDGVLVANGHLWSPKIPAVPGEFTGTQLHSSEYQNVKDLQGNRVLVVGAGNSGCDLAVDVAQHRLEADIVMRKGIHFQPKMYFGMPRAEVPFLAEYSPEEQDFISRLLAKVSIGEATNYPGMPQPENRTLADSAVTVNDLMLYWVHHGRIGVKPGIVRFEGKTVHFSDGSAKDYDNILWATGFDVRLPFLAEDLITWRDGVPVRYAGGILPEGAENLLLRRVDLAAWPADPDLRRAEQVGRPDDPGTRAGRTGLRVGGLLRTDAGRRAADRHRPAHLDSADGRQRKTAGRVGSRRRRRWFPARRGLAPGLADRRTLRRSADASD